MPGFIRRYNFFPSLDVISLIEGAIIIDAPPPGEQVGDAFRTEIMVKLGGKEHTAVFPGGSPAALAPLQAEVQTLIERAKAQGKHGLYRNGKKIEPR